MKKRLLNCFSMELGSRRSETRCEPKQRKSRAQNITGVTDLQMTESLKTHPGWNPAASRSPPPPPARRRCPGDPGRWWTQWAPVSSAAPRSPCDCGWSPAAAPRSCRPPARRSPPPLLWSAPPWWTSAESETPYSSSCSATEKRHQPPNRELNRH